MLTWVSFARTPAYLFQCMRPDKRKAAQTFSFRMTKKHRSQTSGSSNGGHLICRAGMSGMSQLRPFNRDQISVNVRQESRRHSEALSGRFVSGDCRSRALSYKVEQLLMDLVPGLSEVQRGHSHIMALDPKLLAQFDTNCRVKQHTFRPNKSWIRAGRIL